MDARRSISPLIAVAGLAAVSIGIAASPGATFAGEDRGALALVLVAAVGPIFGAATAGYALHRDAGPGRAARWALAFVVAAAGILVATFGMAAIIRPIAGATPGLQDAWYGVIAGGVLVGFVGAFLGRREAAAGRRFAALGLLGCVLLVGWVLAAARGDWGSAAQDFPLSATGVAFIAVALDRPWPPARIAATSVS